MASKKKAGDTSATKGRPSGSKPDGREPAVGKRRPYEYDHQYGLVLQGKAIPAKAKPKPKA